MLTIQIISVTIAAAMLTIEIIRVVREHRNGNDDDKEKGKKEE